MKSRTLKPNGHPIIQETGRITRRGFIGASLAALSGLGFKRENRVFEDASFREQGGLKIKEYRTLGRTGFKVSDIGLGGGDLSNANLLAASLDAGINYFDTAEHYGRGTSERTIGEVLKTRDRKSVFLTTKLNLTFVKGVAKEDIKNRFLKCLERLQTNYVDCLMLHMCTLAQVKYEPYHEAILELKAEGKVRFSGLSNHGADYSIHGPLSDPMDQVVLAAAEDGRFDVVLFVYNFIKTDMGDKILKACKLKGMGTTLMKTNPALTVGQEEQTLEQAETRFKAEGKEIPDYLSEAKKFTEQRSAQTEVFTNKYGLAGSEQVRDAAIKFCLSRPEVHSVCPSINTFEELEVFIKLSGMRLEDKEVTMLEDYRNGLGRYYCRHACGLCEPACPHGVPVNTIMRYNHYFLAQGREKMAMAEYAVLPGNRADRCAGCAGRCQKACPYGVPIQALLVIADRTLTLA